MHFLEIYFHIFKYYIPEDFFLADKVMSLKDHIKNEASMKGNRLSKLSSRHSRFGTSIQTRIKTGKDGYRSTISSVIENPN